MSQVGGIRRPVSPDYSLKFAEVCFLEFKWKQSLSLVEIKRNEDYFLFSFGSRALIDGPHVRENPADSFEG